MSAEKSIHLRFASTGVKPEINLDELPLKVTNGIWRELDELRIAATDAEWCFRRAVMLAPGETRDAELAEVRRRCKQIANCLREISGMWGVAK